MLRNVVVGSRRLGSVVDHEKGVACFFVSPSFIRTKHFTLEKLLYSQETLPLLQDLMVFAATSVSYLV